MAITGDDVGKGVLAVVFTLLVSAVGWLLSTVFKLKEDVLGGQLRHNHLEAKVAELKAEIAEIKTEALTRECVREEIETALEKRDKQAEQRNAERAILRKHEMKEIVTESLEKLVPKIVHEIRGTTGVVKLHLPPESDQS